MLKSGKIKIYSIRWTWISVYIIFDKRFNYLFHCNFRFSSTHLTGYFKICQVIDCAGCCWCFLCPHLQVKNCFKISLWNRSLKVLMSLFFCWQLEYVVGTCKTVETANKHESLQSKFPAKFKYCFARMLCNSGIRSNGLRAHNRYNVIRQCK